MSSDESKSPQELDLELRLSEDYVSPLARQTGVEPTPIVNDGFIGVSPEYANAANETDAPMRADSGYMKILEDALYARVEENEKNEEEKKEDEPMNVQSTPKFNPPSSSMPPPPVN